jgi:hypothetical protein
MFNFDNITVSELDQALESGRFSAKVRAVLAKASGKTIEELAALNVPAYKKMVAAFVKEAYSPVEADPN